MKRTVAFTLSIAAIVAGSAMIAAPQTRPGEVTKPSVWVENRGQNEAVPTTIESMSDNARPLRTELVGTASVSLSPSTVVQARVVRQAWEHRVLTVPAGQDVSAAIARIDDGSWEAVGFQATPQGAVVLLKRPR